MNIDDLVNAGFPRENFPEDLPIPGETNLFMQPLDAGNELYRYQVNVGGVSYGMEIVVDRGSIDVPAEGVCFMLNQLAYYWRMDRAKIMVAADNSCRRINF